LQVGKYLHSDIVFPFTFGWENTMARTANLENMDVAQLLELRKRIDATLMQRRGDLEKQLRELGTLTDGARDGRRGVSALKGKKVAAKYRGPGDETWAGRGQKPKWLVAAIKEGKTLQDFAIEKGTASKKTRRRKK
jgi:DNA-binding protein H-NS